MSALSLRLPDSVHRHIKELAQQEGVSINQFISSAVAEKVSAIATEDYLQQRAQRADKQAFQRLLARVPNVKHFRAMSCNLVKIKNYTILTWRPAMWSLVKVRA
jgi:HicB family.